MARALYIAEWTTLWTTVDQEMAGRFDPQSGVATNVVQKLDSIVEENNAKGIVHANLNSASFNTTPSHTT